MTSAKVEGDLVRSSIARVRDSLSRPTDLQIVERLQEVGVRTIFTVPCSITRSIDELWRLKAQEGSLNYFLVHNEWAIPALAFGWWLARNEVPLTHMQNSGVPNAGDGEISLRGVYGSPGLDLVTWRGSSKKDDSEPHQAIGRKTQELVNVVKGEEHVYRDRFGRGILRSIEDAARDALIGGHRATILLSPDAFTISRRLEMYEVRDEVDDQYLDNIDRYIGQNRTDRRFVRAQARVSRREALLDIYQANPDAVFIHANGFNSRAAQEIMPDAVNFLNAGNMGGSGAIGAAIALGAPELQVVVINGDGNANMGHLYPFLEYHIGMGRLTNYQEYILDNGKNNSVGSSDALPLTRQHYDFAHVIPTVPDDYDEFSKEFNRVGRGANFGRSMNTDDYDEIEAIEGPLPLHALRFQQEIQAKRDRVRLVA